MNEKFYVVSEDVLPDYFPLIIQARNMVDNENMSISLACEKTGISRSTVYKYRDKVFNTDKSYGKQCILALKIVDSKGVLSHVLAEIYNYGANIITLNVTMPIKQTSYVTITVDASEMNDTLPELTRAIRAVPFVRSVSVVAYE